MTAEEFVKAIQEMKGLLPPMIDSLVAMADAMTEKERAEALKKITPLNKALLKKQEEAIALAQEATGDLQKTRREDLPKLRKFEEESEKAADTGKAEKILGAA